MIVIKNSQIKNIGFKMRKDQLRILLDHALKYYASRLWELSDEEMLKKMNRIAANCAQYGITDIGDISLYLLCAMELGEKFEDRPDHVWAKDILTDSRLTSSERARALDTTLFNRI